MQQLTTSFTSSRFQPVAVDISLSPPVAGATAPHPVCAVIVTYCYPLADLCELLDLLDPVVERIVLVDNTPVHDSIAENAIYGLADQYPSCRLVINRANFGLAKAINQGIRIAIEENYEWFILFDQDSRPAPEMLLRLLAARDSYAGTQPLAALGPAIWDMHREAPWPFIRFRFSGFRKIIPDMRRSIAIDADMLITSGCLISAKAIGHVGMMDERLFIDNIDLEWSFRCKAGGYRLLGVSDAMLCHKLGDTIKRVAGTDRYLVVHKPVRQYHMTRNRVLLYWRAYIPLAWKLHDFPRLIYKIIVYPIAIPPRRENFAMLIKGLLHGLLRR